MVHWGVLLIPAIALTQLVAGVIGIGSHWGWGWSVGAVVVALWWRFTLPLMVGTYIGATEVWGWPWYFAVFITLPGLLLLLPGAAIELTRWVSFVRARRSFAQIDARQGGALSEPAGLTAAKALSETIQPEQRQQGNDRIIAMVLLISFLGALVVVGLWRQAELQRRNQGIDEKLSTVAAMMSGCEKKAHAQMVSPATNDGGGLEQSAFDANITARLQTTLPLPPNRGEVSDLLLYLERNGPQPVVSCAALAKVHQDLLVARFR